MHVAFAAGTGILTFMDLVAHIARTCISKVEKQKRQNKINDRLSTTSSSFMDGATQHQYLADQLSLVLYVSFNS
jgi:hypothetical protein